MPRAPPASPLSSPRPRTSSPARARLAPRSVNTFRAHEHQWHPINTVNEAENWSSPKGARLPLPPREMFPHFPSSTSSRTGSVGPVRRSALLATSYSAPHLTSSPTAASLGSAGGLSIRSTSIASSSEWGRLHATKPTRSSYTPTGFQTPPGFSPTWPLIQENVLRDHDAFTSTQRLFSQQQLAQQSDRVAYASAGKGATSQPLIRSYSEAAKLLPQGSRQRGLVDTQVRSPII